MLPLWIKRPLHLRRLKDPSYRFLFDAPPPGEAVSIDCETTGLDRRRDDIVSIAAVRIKGNRILTSQRFEVLVRPTARMNPAAIKIHHLRERDVAVGRAMAEVLPALLRFIGPRPLVGYYLEFDVAMINRYLRAWLGISLPNPQFEVSGLYYDRKYGDAPPGTHIDLTFASLARDLKLDLIDQHDALADATTAAVMYVMLKDLQARRARIARAPYTPAAGFTGG